MNLIGYDMTSTPEPGSVTMLGAIALGVSGYYAWKRKRRVTGVSV